MANQATRKSTGLSPMALLVLGGMLFSMFFGAGNLILPPLLGLQAGSEAVPATIGFLIAGIGLPILGIIAVALCGNAHTLIGRVNPRFAAVFIALVYLTIGPFLAIPRTSSTAFEMLAPLMGDAGNSMVTVVIFSVVFFAIAFALALKPGLLSRILGKVTAPALIVLILIVVGASLFAGPYEVAPAQAPYTGQALTQGFLNGYQTMDLLAALCFGIVVAANVREQGVTEEGATAKAICIAGLIAGVLMVAIYCGLSFVGATAATVVPGATNGAEILAAQAHAHFGLAGSIIIAVIFLLACLNVCTGLISCCSEYFAERFTRIPLPAWAAIFAVFSCCVSLVGLDTILAFSAPLLGVLYPPAIVLVIMGMLHKLFDKAPRTWQWVVIAVTVYSVLSGLCGVVTPQVDVVSSIPMFGNALVSFFGWLNEVLGVLPFADLGLGWVLVAGVALVIGLVHSQIDKRLKA